MIGLDLGAWFAQAVGGTMILALPVAAVAGLVSFFSPCVVPLLPGYLSYATGLSAADVQQRRRPWHLVAGTGLFILGFTLVFVTTGVLAGTAGRWLFAWSTVITRVLGVVTIVLGLAFAGWIPMTRQWKLSWAPRMGVAAAPLLGIVFGIGWTPCIGPTLAVVLTLALNEGSALRGGILAVVYCLGLGLPFLLAALAYRRMSRAVAWVRDHQQLVLRIGGVMMILVGLLLVSGLWDHLMAWMRQWVAGFELVV